MIDRDPYQEMHDIALEILDGWKERGQINYGDGFVELGAAGQFSDIWRKVKKLQRSVWEGKQLVGEQPEQVAAEIIPHCLMLIWLLREGHSFPPVKVNEFKEIHLPHVGGLSINPVGTVDEDWLRDVREYAERRDPRGQR